MTKQKLNAVAKSTKAANVGQPGKVKAPKEQKGAPKGSDAKPKSESGKKAKNWVRSLKQKKMAAVAEEVTQDNDEAADGASASGDEEASADQGQKRENIKRSFKEILLSGVDDFKSLYIIELGKVSNKDFNDLHNDWKASRLHRGKHAMEIAREAFGSDEESSYASELYKVAEKLSATNDLALLFTSRPREEVEAFFASYTNPCYPKPGYVHDETITIPTGMLPFPVSMAGQLSNMGLKVEAKPSEKEVVLLQPYTLCKKNQGLSGDQARLCHLLGKRIARVQMRLVSRWEEGSFEDY